MGTDNVKIYIIKRVGRKNISHFFDDGDRVFIKNENLVEDSFFAIRLIDGSAQIIRAIDFVSENEDGVSLYG